MFECIIAAHTDPILGLADLFCADSRINKINLGIGVYKDSTGKTPILNSVKKAEEYLLKNEMTKNYLSIDGISDFALYSQELLFGVSSSIRDNKRARTAQTPGGTSALRIAADFIATQTSSKRVWISNPTWLNHKNIFTAVGLQVYEYQYCTATGSSVLDFDILLNSLSKAHKNDVVLFHACCHNPTGIDPNDEQWKKLAELSFVKGWLPLFDFAYQGFSSGLEKDAQSIRTFAAIHNELIICSSFSKNFGLYNERVGAVTLVAKDSVVVDVAFSQIKAIIRSNYSTPPSHGAAVVTTILNNKTLRILWEQELTIMRNRIKQMRKLFVNTLKEKHAKNDLSCIINHNGMFSCIEITKEQVIRLRKDFGIYIVNSGRINIAGMTPNNIPSLCEALITVL